MTTTTCTTTCELHNVQCCATCCVHPGDCDFGGCHRKATTIVDSTMNGKVTERRPACRRHANHGPLGVGYRHTTEER